MPAPNPNSDPVRTDAFRSDDPLTLSKVLPALRRPGLATPPSAADPDVPLETSLPWRDGVVPPLLPVAPPPLPDSPPPLPTVPPPLPAVPPPLPAALENVSLPPAALDPWSGFSTATKPGPGTDENLPATAPASPANESTTPRARIKDFGRLGHYDLKQVIGEGGMGVVFKAEDALLKRPVAVKVLKPEIARDERALKLFLTEAQATAALKDDRIATIYQVDESRGQFYLAMELLHGESLETRLRRGPVSIEQATWIAREAALGLSVAHRGGFVHRDIKPANLWLEASEGYQPAIDPLGKFRKDDKREPQFHRVKILDFGLARLGPAGPGDIAGTPAYMAPEQAAGRTATERSDIFALGVVLYRLLAHRLPFEGDTPMELMTAIATQTAPPVAQLNPKVPPALSELVAQMISRDPMGRPGSADDVARLLEAIERHAIAPPPTPVSSRKNMAVIAGIVILAVLGLFAGWWFGIRGRSDPNNVPLVAPVAAGGVQTPAEVVHAIGDRVTVEFVVGAIRRIDDSVYLYEKPPGNDELTFRVVLPSPLVASMKKRGSPWPDGLLHARLRLNGVVARDGRYAEILASDIDQFDKILYAERKTETPAAPLAPPGKDGVTAPPGAIGQDRPATASKSRRPPVLQKPDEIKDTIEDAVREMLTPFMGKPGTKSSSKSGAKSGSAGPKK